MGKSFLGQVLRQMCCRFRRSYQALHSDSGSRGAGSCMHALCIPLHSLHIPVTFPCMPFCIPLHSPRIALAFPVSSLAFLHSLCIPLHSPYIAPECPKAFLTDLSLRIFFKDLSLWNFLKVFYLGCPAFPCIPFTFSFTFPCIPFAFPCVPLALPLHSVHSLAFRCIPCIPLHALTFQFEQTNNRMIYQSLKDFSK